MLRALFVVALFITNCSSSKGAKETPLPETICNPSETKCFGNYVGTCKQDGKGWAFAPCFPNHYCKEISGSAICDVRACTPPGSARCSPDRRTAYKCSADGSTEIPTQCKEGEECWGGECRPVPCDAGDQYCVYDGEVTCTGGGWEESKCSKNEKEKKACGCGGQETICAGSKCIVQICTPEETVCDNATRSKTCNLTGTQWIFTECTKDSECREGFCQKKVANPPEPVPEVIEPEPKEEVIEDLPPQEPKEDLPKPEVITPGVNKANVNGVEVKFWQLADANWVSADQRLMINLYSKKVDGVPGVPDGSSHKLEIRIVGIEEGQVGTFTCEGIEGAAVEFWYRWGKYQQGEKCKDFDYQGAKCTVTLEEFGPVGGKVKGTFDNAVLIDCMQDGTQIEITDGVFEVIRGT